MILGSDVDRWLWWDWIGRNTETIYSAAREHVIITVLAVGLGIVVALPLGVAAARWRRLYAPTLSVTGVIYTIPSLALFAMLLAYTGLSRTTAVIPLASYTLLILVRNTVAGLDGVPRENLEAADAMGYSNLGRLVRIELPLALPAIMAGVRIATVTTIGLLTVASIVGLGGLGTLIIIGLNRPVRTAVTVGAVLSVAFAIISDLLLNLLQRRLTPWAREAS